MADTYKQLSTVDSVTTLESTDKIVVNDSNTIKQISVEKMKEVFAIGDLTQLNTTDKSNLVNAINEVKASAIAVSVSGKTLVFGSGE